MKNSILLVLLSAFSGLVGAQPVLERKCAPSVMLQRNEAGSELFTLQVIDPNAFQIWANEQGIVVVRIYSPARLIVVRATRQELTAKILPRPDVLFVDRSEIIARAELPVPGHNLFANRINIARAVFPFINGAGIVLSVKEHRFDTSDVDILHRAAYATGAFPQASVHAGIMATLAGGARVPGCSWELDPVAAAFNVGTLVRWLDFNDTWLAAEWGHPSDNLGAILALAAFVVSPARCRPQASALAFSLANSSWLMVPASSSALASAMWAAGDLPATSRM